MPEVRSSIQIYRHILLFFFTAFKIYIVFKFFLSLVTILFAINRLDCRSQFSTDNLVFSSMYDNHVREKNEWMKGGRTS